jgi:tetratricopeptide (TPR) repeat protein
MLSIDPQNTRVVLVGSSKFLRDPTNLPRLPAVARNVEGLKRVLADPQVVGIPSGNIIVLLNKPAPYDVVPKVANEARKAVDAFIFYYSGHGIVGKRTRELYLATENTTYKNAEFGTAIPFEDIRRAISESTARKRILILDCCYSGRAIACAMGPEASMQQASLDLEGTYSIASAPANKVAISPEGEKYTAFTGELLRVLDDGLDNGKEELTISDIYDHIRNEFRRRSGLPEPQQSMYQDASGFVMANNRKYSQDSYEKQLDVDLQPELQQATQALERLRNGNSHRVSKAASQILGTHTKVQGLGEEAGAESVLEVVEPSEPETTKAPGSTKLKNRRTQRSAKWRPSSIEQVLITATSDILTEALATACSVEGASSRAAALSEVADALGQAGRITEALATARGIKQANARVSALRNIANALGQAGRTQEAGDVLIEALAAARSIKEVNARVSALRNIANALGQAGRTTEALATARSIAFGLFRTKGASSRAAALSGVANALGQAGRTQEAGDVLTEALAAARSIWGASSRAAALSEVADALGQAGRITEALATARGIKQANARVSALRNITEALGQAGRITEALATARSIKQANARALALSNVAKVLT